MSGLPPPSHCANCGAGIPPKARACPACGADERTGWREQSIYDGLDLPDENSSQETHRETAGIFWKTAIIVLLAAVGLLVLLNRFGIIS